MFEKTNGSRSTDFLTRQVVVFTYIKYCNIRGFYFRPHSIHSGIEIQPVGTRPSHPRTKEKENEMYLFPGSWISPIKVGCSINFRANYLRNELTVMRPRPQHRARCSNHPPPTHPHASPPSAPLHLSTR